MMPDADRAIAILEKIKVECGAAALAYYVLPNVVLTLSGARAYCDGVFWSEDQAELDQWNTEITQSLEALRRATEVVAAISEVQSVRENQKCASFEIVLEAGLNYVLDHTGLLSKRPLLPVGSSSIKKSMEALVLELKNKDEFKEYSDENLRHVAFGILVGYPDKAISESVLLWEQDDPFMEPLVDADIRGAGYYICPQPVYSYPRHLINDPDIKANEKLWSRILNDYYHSHFHASLENDKAFLAKMEQLGNLR